MRARAGRTENLPRFAPFCTKTPHQRAPSRRQRRPALSLGMTTNAVQIAAQKAAGEQGRFGELERPVNSGVQLDDYRPTEGFVAAVASWLSGCPRTASYVHPEEIALALDRMRAGSGRYNLPSDADVLVVAEFATQRLEASPGQDRQQVVEDAFEILSLHHLQRTNRSMLDDLRHIDGYSAYMNASDRYDEWYRLNRTRLAEARERAADIEAVFGPAPALS